MFSPLHRLPTLLLAAALMWPTTAAAQFDFDLGFNGSDSGGFDGAQDDPVELTVELTEGQEPGQATLAISAKIQDGWHVYSLTQPAGGPQRTTIIVDPSNQYTANSEFTASPAPESHIDQVAWPGLEIQEHLRSVTWSVPLRLAEGATADEVRVAGKVRMQACQTDGVCLPLTLDFVVNQDAKPAASSAPLAPVDTTPTTSGNSGDSIRGNSTNSSPQAYDLTKIQLGAERTTAEYLLLAFFGGLALNLMPCVLPVIGLKIMSFVGQAGKSRVHAFALNMWYALGIMAVFWVLGGLAIGAGYRWSDQAGSELFNIGMAALVMAMGLSLLGVWEIPIPGFLGSNTTQQAASKEGALGAWLKGVITTLLAIPCTGPGMAVALGWSVGKDWPAVMSVFSAIGLGMASPYLVIGAFPGLVKFLPKPGAWMETFKQLMGFVLMGTVVFLLSLLPPQYIVPTLAFLTAIGLACWIYAGTPITASTSDKWQSYALCGAVLFGGGVLAFGWLQPSVTGPRYDAQVAAAVDKSLSEQFAESLEPGTTGFVNRISIPGKGVAEINDHWGPFSLEALGELAVNRGKTVLVDFGAEWCLTCKTLENTVLHTKPVERALEDAGVATLYADYTDTPPELKRMLDSLRSQSVPVVAIFPGDNPYRPTVFRGHYSQTQLIEAIEQASGQPIEKVAVAPSGR